MIRWTATRVAASVATLLLASLGVFAALAVLPGDPAQVALGVDATPEALAAQRAAFGTDRPWWVQYLDWVGGWLRGDLGVSYVTHLPVGQSIGERLGTSVSLIGGSVLVALLVAIPLGTAAAWWRSRPWGAALSAVSQAGIAIPNFLAGMLLIWLVAVVAGRAPADGYVALADDPLRWMQHLVLPWLALGAIQGAALSRFVRSAVLDVGDENFMRTARAVGLSRSAALLRHGARNVALPLTAVLGVQLTTLVVGGVVVERTFTLPGLGDLLLEAVGTRDLLVVQDLVMLVLLVTIALQLAAELLYRVLDPRLRGG